MKINVWIYPNMLQLLYSIPGDLQPVVHLFLQDFGLLLQTGAEPQGGFM